MNNKELTLTVIDFDKEGNPIPYDLINLNIEELNHNFVELIPESKTRSNIFNGYLVYNDNLSTLLKTEWKQWVNGSYTTKKENPNDIDLVNIIDVDTVNNAGESIKSFLSKFSDCKDKYLVDGFLSISPDENHSHNQYFIDRLAYWKKWFSHDREMNSKGIIVVLHRNDI